MPEGAPNASTPEESAAAARKKAWGAFLDAELKARDWRNTDMARRLDEVAEQLQSDAKFSQMVSLWRGGKAGPSETGAMHVALALALPVPYVLRKAEHKDAAKVYEMQPRPDETGEAERRAASLKADIDELVRLARIGQRIQDAQLEQGGDDNSRDAS